MKVLVTGHRGYIGVEMVPALRLAGHEVIGLDTGLFDECDFLSPPDAVKSLAVDLRDVTPEHLAGFDAIVHLAALSNDPLGDLDAQITYDINWRASIQLARGAKVAGVRRFLFSSSCSLYGAGGESLLNETAAFHPVTPYGESKVRVEEGLSKLADAAFSPVYLRNATAYGVSRRLRADIVVNNLVAHAFTSGKVLMQSDGTPWRPLVHVQDINAAFVACLAAPADSIHDQAFNVGRTGENFQIRDVAKLVAEAIPHCELAFATGASPDARNYRVDFSKIESQLPGYTPRWTLSQGIDELHQAYQRAHLTAEIFGGSTYHRLRTVRDLQKRGILGSELRWLSQQAGSST
jgi:nucleoside-diphosphate-sugar epimerase